MSDLIGRIMKEVKVERDAAEQGAGETLPMASICLLFLCSKL